PRMPAVQAIQFRTDFGLRARADRVTRQAHVEHRLALLSILGKRGPSQNGDSCSRDNKDKDSVHFFSDTLDHASSRKILWLCNRFPSQISYSMYWESTMKSALLYTHLRTIYF